MSTIETPSELEAFNRYIREQYGGSLNGHTLEEAVADFREYQRQLADLRAKIREAEESSARGESRVLTEADLQEKFNRLDAQLRREGIAD